VVADKPDARAYLGLAKNNGNYVSEAGHRSRSILITDPEISSPLVYLDLGASYGTQSQLALVSAPKNLKHRN
jgi:hypothetical protein